MAAWGWYYWHTYITYTYIVGEKCFEISSGSITVVKVSLAVNSHKCKKFWTTFPFQSFCHCHKMCQWSMMLSYDEFILKVQVIVPVSLLNFPDLRPFFKHMNLHFFHLWVFKVYWCEMHKICDFTVLYYLQKRLSYRTRANNSRSYNSKIFFKPQYYHKKHNKN